MDKPLIVINQWSIRQKAHFLKESGCKYSLSWLYSDIRRLHAMFEKAYTKAYAEYQKQLELTLAEEHANHQFQQNVQAELMKSAYNHYYHRNYTADLKANPAETTRRALAISHLWLDN